MRNQLGLPYSPPHPHSPVPQGWEALSASSPGQQAWWRSPEEGPSELAVAMAMAVLEFDHWGLGVGVGS